MIKALIVDVLIYINGNPLLLKTIWIIIITLAFSSYIYLKKYYGDIRYARRELGISTRSSWKMKSAPKYFKKHFFLTYLNAYIQISVLMGIVSIVYINSFSIFGNEVIMFFIPLFILCSEIINSDITDSKRKENYNKYTLIDDLFNVIDLIKTPIINIFKIYSPDYFVKKELTCLIYKLKDSNYLCYEKYYKDNQDTHLGEYILRLKNIVLRNVGEENLKKDDLSECFNLDNEEQRLELEYITTLKKSLENLFRYYINSLDCPNNSAAIQIYYELNNFFKDPSKYSKVKSFICLASLQTELSQSAQSNRTIAQINKEIKDFYDTNYSVNQITDYIEDSDMLKELQNIDVYCEKISNQKRRTV